MSVLLKYPVTYSTTESETVSLMITSHKFVVVEVSSKQLDAVDMDQTQPSAAQSQARTGPSKII